MTPEGPERTILFHPSPSLPLALRTADRSIIRRTPPFEVKKKKKVRYIGGWTFSTWCIARKTFRYKKGPFSHERREERISSLLSLSREGKKERGWGEGGNGAGALLLRPSLLFVSREELPARSVGKERFGPTYPDKTS